MPTQSCIYLFAETWIHGDIIDMIHVHMHTHISIFCIHLHAHARTTAYSLKDTYAQTRRQIHRSMCVHIQRANMCHVLNTRGSVNVSRLDKRQTKTKNDVSTRHLFGAEWSSQSGTTINRRCLRRMFSVFARPFVATIWFAMRGICDVFLPLCLLYFFCTPKHEVLLIRSLVCSKQVCHVLVMHMSLKHSLNINTSSWWRSL